MAEPIKLLRTDGRGRVRTPRERQEMLLAEYERSGASAAEFAKLSGVKYQTFAGWVQRRRKERESEPGVKAVPMVEVSVEAEPEREGVEVVLELPGGAQVELRNVGQVPLVSALIKALATQGVRRC